MPMKLVIRHIKVSSKQTIILSLDIL